VHDGMTGAGVRRAVYTGFEVSRDGSWMKLDCLGRNAAWSVVVGGNQGEQVCHCVWSYEGLAIEQDVGIEA
jgi:hypothetical protein